MVVVVVVLLLLLPRLPLVIGMVLLLMPLLQN